MGPSRLGQILRWPVAEGAAGSGEDDAAQSVLGEALDALEDGAVLAIRLSAGRPPFRQPAHAAPAPRRRADPGRRAKTRGWWHGLRVRGRNPALPRGAWRAGRMLTPCVRASGSTKGPPAMSVSLLARQMSYKGFGQGFGQGLDAALGGVGARRARLVQQRAADRAARCHMRIQMRRALPALMAATVGYSPAQPTMPVTTATACGCSATATMPASPVMTARAGRGSGRAARGGGRGAAPGGGGCTWGAHRVCT